MDAEVSACVCKDILINLAQVRPLLKQHQVVNVKLVPNYFILHIPDSAFKKLYSGFAIAPIQFV